MKKLLATIALVLLLAPRVWANCTVTGTVFNPDGSPLANGTVQFNSVVQQTLQGGAVIPPTQVSTPTNASGVMAPISLVPGLQGQFVFCSPAAGGCGNPTPVLIPIATTADISSILIGIQLQTGANVNAGSLNVTGNSTLGGTLVVGGATTINSTLNVTGNITGGGALNITGAAQVGSPLVVNGANAVMSFPGAPGSIVTAPYATSYMAFASGTHYDGTNWIADSTRAEYMDLFSGSVEFFIGQGLTVGQPWYPHNTGTPARSQYMAVGDSGSTSGLGMYVEQGGVDVENGMITANYNVNNASTIVMHNPSGGNTGLALLRAQNNYTDTNNGIHVTDVGMPGTNSTNLGGWFHQDRGYVASNGSNGFLVEATGAGAAAVLFLAAPNSNLVRVVGNEHFGVANDGVSAPSANPATCGGATSGTSTNSTDAVGDAFVGNSGSNSCVVQFAAGFSAVSCVCSTRGTTWCSVNPSASGISMYFGATLVNTWVSWICMEHDA